MNRITDLSGEWQLHPVTEFSTLWVNADAPSEGWTVQSIPAHWQQAANFKDYSGKMVFRKEFSLAPEKDRLYRLEVGGVFYRYRLYLNNFALGGAKGYFYPTYYNITPYLKDHNLLVLEVDSPKPTEDDEVITGLFSGYPGFPEEYNPGGIWRPVRLLTSGPAYIGGWRLSMLELVGDRSRLMLEAEVYASRDLKAELRLSMRPHNFSGSDFALEFSVHLTKGVNRIKETFEAIGVHPWWTWDLGEPNLYKVDLYVTDHQNTFDLVTDLFGARLFELKESIPYLNGERFFIKGANYLPATLYPADLERETFERDLSMVKAANQNALRCYRHLESEEFYRATDEAGILVWQDFPLKPEFSGRHFPDALQQAAEMVSFLYNRASVVLWSPGSLRGFEEQADQKEGKRVTSGLKSVCEQVAKELKDHDPTRAVLPFSGRRGMLCSSSFEPGLPLEPADQEGTFSFDQYRPGFTRKNIKFVSWFGAPSISEQEPGVLTMEKTGVSAQREVNLERNPQRMKEAYAATRSPEDTAIAGQEYQGEVLRFYIDRLRYHKYNPTGGMFLFCLRSIVPGPFCSIIDSLGNTKKSYDTVKLCYRPLYVFALLKKEIYRRGELLHFPICLSNDRHEPSSSALQIKARLTDTDGQLVWKDQWNVTPTPDGTTIILGYVSVMLMKKGEYLLEIVWEDGEIVENTYRIFVK